MATKAENKIKTDELKEQVENLRRKFFADTPEADACRLNFAIEKARYVANRRKANCKFSVYSCSNEMLIETQARRLGTANRRVGITAGEKEWKEQGRVLRPEAVPYQVWMPIFEKVEDDGTSNTDKKDKAVKAFILGTVYDYGDTISTDPDFVEPSWELPLAVGDQETLDRLVEISSVPVRFENLGGASETGFLSSAGYIVIDSDGHRPIGSMIATMCHELGHEELQHHLKLAKEKDKEAALAIFEPQAETVSFLVMWALGLGDEVGNDLTERAASYLRSWDKNGQVLMGHNSRAKLFNAHLDAAITAASAIVDRFLK